MVKITIARQLDGTPTTVEEYEEGGYWLVRDGHLHVLTSNHRDATHLASYAPGQWLTAAVEAQAA